MGMWQPFAILDIIARETYAGIWRFGVRIGPTEINVPEKSGLILMFPSC